MTKERRQNKTIAYPIHELLGKRWSPRAFDPGKSVTDEQVVRLFEAARWTPSSFNAQPWQYAYALRDQGPGFADLLDVLMPGNQVWAKQAGMLVAGLTQWYDPEKDRKNGKAEYDLGAANFALTVQAMDMGLWVHQMGGFYPDKVRELLELSEHIKPVVMLAIGHMGRKDDLPEDIRKREVGRKDRKTQSTFVKKL